MKHTDLMPWGVHKGKQIGNVSFEYLYRFYKKQWISGEVLIYFEKQLKELEESEARMCELSGKMPKKYLIEDYVDRFPKKAETNPETFKQGPAIFTGMVFYKKDGSQEFVQKK